MKSICLKGIFLLALVGFCSCQPSEKKADMEVIPIEEAFRRPATLKASDYFKKLHYISLETGDSILVGNSPTVRVSGDRLIVTTQQKQCLVFDKSTGRFVTSVGHIGNDPQGSMELDGWLNAAAGYLYFNKGNGVSVVYDVNGRFVGTVRDLEMTDGIFGVDSYDYLTAETLVKHLPATDKKPDRILVYRDTTRLATFPSHGELRSSVSGKISDIQQVGVFKLATLGHSMMYITFAGGKQLSVVATEQPFWHVGEKLYFREFFNDTIYQVTEQGLASERRFDFGSMRWNREDRFELEKDEAIYPLDVLENDRFLWLRFVVNLHHEDKRKGYNALYLKETGEVKVNDYDEGLENDLNGFMPLQPTFISSTGECYQIIPAEEIVNWFDEHPDTSDFPAEIQALRKLTAEDNPVVVCME